MTMIISMCGMLTYAFKDSADKFTGLFMNDIVFHMGSFLQGFNELILEALLEFRLGCFVVIVNMVVEVGFMYSFV